MTQGVTITCDTCHQVIDPNGPRYQATFTFWPAGPNPVATVESRDYHENHVPGEHPKPTPH